MLTISTSVLLSGAGIGIAAHTGQYAEGGRGGALAVAFSFIILFLRRNYGGRLYDAILHENPELEKEILDLRNGKPLTALNPEHQTRLLVAVISRLNLEADGQKHQNVALAWASVIGTLAWGFGDELAKCRFF